MTNQEQVKAQHNRFMKMALTLAQKAGRIGEVPVGAVVVISGKVVGKGYNQSIRKNDPTAHAEILALRQAARKIGNYRLTSATVYCTLEPCLMCAGALIWARVGCLVYGAKDLKAGAIDSHLGLAQARFSNHRYRVISGVLGKDSVKLLKQFFKNKRMSRK
jgi:tRNA(adenine34) deaminase